MVILFVLAFYTVFSMAVINGVKIIKRAILTDPAAFYNMGKLFLDYLVLHEITEGWLMQRIIIGGGVLLVGFTN
jgi:hypothetical protein